MSRALVLSGGGSHGAFQVGVLRYLAEQAVPADWYRHYYGVSVGAINAAQLAQRDSPDGAYELMDMWLDLTDRKVKKRWFPFGRLHALWRRGLYDTTPLRDLLVERLDPKLIQDLGNTLHVEAVSLITLQRRVFDESHPDLIDGILASSAYPLVMPPVQLGDDWLVDGGVREIVPLSAALRNPHVTSVDVILADRPSPVMSYGGPGSIIDVGTRCLAAAVAEIYRGDLDVLRVLGHGQSTVAGKTVRVIKPGRVWDHDPMLFDPQAIIEMAGYGYARAHDVLGGR